ncbi:MAG: PPC domain-containing protein, partial [Phormidesmis sp.]
MATPTVSFQTVAGTFSGSRDETRDRILAPELVEFLGEDSRDASVLSFVFNVDGDIPAEGLEVVVGVDSNFAEYFNNLGRNPFGGGGEVVGAVYEDDGVTPTGIKFLLTSSKALFSLAVAQSEAAETDGPETLNFALAAGEGYTADPAAQASTVTFYDTLADVPDLGAGPQISLSADQTELIETEGTELTLTFNVDGEIPEGGVLVYVSSETGGAVGEFNVFGGEVTGGILPPPNFAVSGFYFTILEDGASIKVPVFDETTNPEIDPADAVEGLEEFTFSMVEGPGYTIAPDAGSVTYSIADAPGALPLLSLSTSPEVLIESEGTVSVHTFQLSAAPPAEGITVSVGADALGEFDLDQIVVTGGEIASVNADGSGFELTMTAQEVIVELPVADDGEAEGVEEAVFALIPGEGYLLRPDPSDPAAPNPNGSVFTIVDTPESAPTPVEETNDTIATAIATGLTTGNNIVSISSELDQQRDPAVDRTEDVDMYSVELAAGDTVRIDVDAAILESELDSVLRLFDADGNQLSVSDDDFAPDELFGQGRRDSYVEYTADTAGTYYVGVSSCGNGEFDFFADDEGNPTNAPYDPTVAGSGTGRSFGEYTLNLSLNTEATPAPTEIAPSTGEGPTVSLSATSGTFDGDDNLLAGALVQSVEDGASILTLGLTVEGEIPAAGLEVFLTSDADLRDAFSTGSPFSPGAEVLGAVYDEAGVPVGLRLNVTSPVALVNLVLDNPEEAPADGESAINFTLEPSAGYVVGDNTFSTTIYDSLTDVPTPTVVPEVSFSISESNLVESENTLTTLNFELSEAPPAEGVLVYVDSGTRGALGEFAVTNAEISGGAVPAPNFQSSGFFFRITEQSASITLSAFDETTNPEIAPEDALEGIEELTFTVQPASGYTIAPDAGAATLTIADNPDSVVIPDNGDGDGDGEEPAIPFETELNDTLATA